MNHDSTHQKHQKETGNCVKNLDNEQEGASKVTENEHRSRGAQIDE